MQMKNPIFKVCFSLSLRLLLVVENLRLVSPHLPFRFSSFPVPHAAHDTGSWTLSFTLLPDIFYARRPRLFYMYVSEYIFFLGLLIQPQIHRGILRINRNPITQVMKFRSAILARHSETHWNYIKFEHENGSKFGPPFKRNI